MKSTYATLEIKGRVFKLHKNGDVEVGPDRVPKKEVDDVMRGTGFLSSTDGNTVLGRPVDYDTEDGGVIIGDERCSLQISYEELERIQNARELL